MFLSKIAQNVSPGPAKYNGHQKGIGGNSQSIATKLDQGGALTANTSQSNVGPGTYDDKSI